MPAPTANFQFTVSGLVASFTDTSLPNQATIASWQWSFGDGNSSTDQNPSHTYSTGGVYIVKLTVTNADGETFKVHTLLAATAPSLAIPIIAQVQCKIPYNDMACLQAAIQKWQLLLQYGPDPAIPDADVFDETAWPPLYNALIADLTAYSLLIDLFNKYSLLAAETSLTQAGQIISSSQSTTTTSSTSGVGALKKLETGPSNAEWYNALEGNTTESGAKLLASYFKQGESVIKEFKSIICTWADRLGVQLNICGKQKLRPQGPSILRRAPCTSVWSKMGKLLD
jgi:PKD repeat protein